MHISTHNFTFYFGCGFPSMHMLRMAAINKDCHVVWDIIQKASERLDIHYLGMTTALLPIHLLEYAATSGALEYLLIILS